MGKFTAKGLLVAALHFKTCSSKTSGYIDPDPIIPSPPAFETAEANSQPEHQIIPAWIMGKLIEKSAVILFFI